jgi:hypothetical protein
MKILNSIFLNNIRPKAPKTSFTSLSSLQFEEKNEVLS